MRRLAAIISLVLGLTLLAAHPASAAVTAPAENPASGSAAALANLISEDTRLSKEAIRENAGLAYDIASDDAVAARGAASAANVANKVNHIFREGKNLEGLVRASGGSAETAYRGVQEAANEALRSGALKPGANGILPGAGQGAILNVNGVNVQLIGGRVIDGVVQLGSFVGLL